MKILISQGSFNQKVWVGSAGEDPVSRLTLYTRIISPYSQFYFKGTDWSIIHEVINLLDEAVIPAKTDITWYQDASEEDFSPTPVWVHQSHTNKWFMDYILQILDQYGLKQYLTTYMCGGRFPSQAWMETHPETFHNDEGLWLE